MTCMKFLLLADCRSGGTAVRKLLIQRGFEMPDDEPLLIPWEHQDSPTDPMIFMSHEGIHAQRYQLDDLNLWERVAELPIKVINLYRLDDLAQYKSWQNAVITGVWHDHQRARPLHDYNYDHYLHVSRDWRLLRDKTYQVFANHPMMDITYEQFRDDNERTVSLIEDFIRGNHGYR